MMKTKVVWFLILTIVLGALATPSAWAVDGRRLVIWHEEERHNPWDEGGGDESVMSYRPRAAVSVVMFIFDPQMRGYYFTSMVESIRGTFTKTTLVGHSVGSYNARTGQSISPKHRPAIRD